MITRARKNQRVARTDAPANASQSECNGKPEHDDGDAAHDPKAVEHHAHLRLLVRWRVFQPVDTAVEAVGSARILPR